MAKRNNSGTINKTSTQNLMEAITGDVTLGIMPYNEAALQRILEKALGRDSQELNWLCRSIGLGYTRQLHKEIAAEFNVAPRTVSRSIDESIKKLQRSPYKMQLKKLVSDHDELDVKIREFMTQGEQLRTVENRVAELEQQQKEAKYRLAAKDKALDHSKAEFKALENENYELAYSNDRLIRRVDELEKALSTANIQLVREKNRAEAAMRAHEKFTASVGNLCMQVLPGELIEEASEVFSPEYAKKLAEKMSQKAAATLSQALARAADFDMAASVAGAAVSAVSLTLESILLPDYDEVLESLKRVGIHTLEDLLKRTAKDLTRMRVGKENVILIEHQLAVYGLRLRAS